MARLRIATLAVASAGFLAGFIAGAGVMAVRSGEQPMPIAIRPGVAGGGGGI